MHYLIKCFWDEVLIGDAGAPHIQAAGPACSRRTRLRDTWAHHWLLSQASAHPFWCAMPSLAGLSWL